MPHWNIIYKTGTVEHVRATVKRLECHGKLMDERYVTVDIDSPSPISFSAGDFMMYRGEKFSIRNIADVEKSARPQSHGGAFSYKGLKLVAQGWQELQDTEMTDYVGINDNRMHYTGLGTFSFYMTKVSDLGYRVQAVLDNKYGTGADGWTVNWPSGQLDNLDEAKSISISAGSSVKDALDLLWQNWGITYTVSRKTITMRPSSAGSILLSYGKGNGLTKIARKLNPNVEICTRVRAYGSERNMPYHWYNNKYEDVNEAMYIPQLMLPHVAAYYDSNGNYVNDAGQLYEAGDDEVVGSVNLWATPNDVVLENVVKSAIYGKRDKEIHWNSDDMGEIFPSMKGMTSDDVPSLDGIYESDIPLDHVTGFHYASESDTGSSSPEDVTSDKLNFVVRVPNPGFNPADHNTADNVELLMQSGMCQARAFTIVRSEAVVSDDKVVAYDLTCAKIIDEEIDQVFPNATYTIKAEDEYVYTGLEFNGDYSQDTWLDVYVQAAERRLLRAAAIWLREHSGEDFVYELTLDNIYMKENPTVAANLVEGAMIQIPDIEFGSNEYEIIDSLTITEGKEAIPTYEITLLRKDESESLGDRVKGLVGQSISASSEIAKANDSLTRKVNKAGFHSLFDPLDKDFKVLDINGDLSALKYIRANVDFFSTGGVSALGVGASGGGGGDTLTEPLASINSASLGMPTVANVGIVWDGSQWTYGSTGGGGGGTDLAAVWSSIAGSTDSYANTKINASHIPGVYMKADNSGDYVAVKFASNMPDELAASTDNGWIEWWQSQKWMNHAMGHLILADSSSQIRTYNGTLFNLPNSGGTLALLGDIPALSISNGVITIGNNTITPVTQVAMTVPTGFTISGSPVTKSGTLALGFTSGYSLPTTAKQSQWDTAYSECHTHSNKSVLDGITSTKVSNWDTAYSECHTHSNKSVLDGITSTKVSNWDTAYSECHTHSNKSVLDGITQTKVDKWDNDYVTLATGQTISGTKTFSTGPILNNATPIRVRDTDGTVRSAFELDQNNIFAIGYGVRNLTGSSTHLYGNSYIRFNLNGSVSTKVTPNGLVIGNDGNETTDTTHYLQIGGGKLCWDNTNKALYVQQADGTAAHFYATGGVSALGMGVSGTASLNTLTLGSLSVSGTASLNTLTLGSLSVSGTATVASLTVRNTISSLTVDDLDVTNVLYMNGCDISMDGGYINNCGTLGADAIETGTLLVGSGSEVKKIQWDGTYLQVQIGTTTYKFRPDVTS